MRKKGVTRALIKAALGHNPSGRTVRFLKKYEDYIERMRKKYPDIPESFYWDDLNYYLTKEI